MSKAKSTKTVTYLGPEADEDLTTVYVIPGAPGEVNVELPLNQAVDVTPAQAKALAADPRHNFKMGEVTPDEVAPWPEYDDLSAEQVLERLDDPTFTATLAVAENVAAYERAHENRKTVVEAAKHQADNFRPAEEAGANGESG